MPKNRQPDPPPKSPPKSPPKPPPKSAAKALKVLVETAPPECSGSEWRAWRQEKGMTQEQLAEATGISAKLIADYEHDRVKPRKRNRALLLQVLDGAWPRTAAALKLELMGRHREMARLMGSHRPKILVCWTDEDGNLISIVELEDHYLFTVGRSVAPTTLDDLRSLRAVGDHLIGRLEQQVRQQANEPER